MTDLSLTEELISLLISKTEEGRLVWDCHRNGEMYETEHRGFSIQLSTWTEDWTDKKGVSQFALVCNLNDIVESKYSFYDQLSKLFNTVRNCHNAWKIKEHFNLLKKVVDSLKE